MGYKKSYFVIENVENKSYYQKTIFKGQRHYVKNIDEARKMTYKQALNIWKKMNDKQSYKIKEVKKWQQFL